MKRLGPLLEDAIAAGLMTRAHAEQVDAWADELATKQCAGEVSSSEVNALVEAKATVDALAWRRRKQSS